MKSLRWSGACLAAVFALASISLPAQAQRRSSGSFEGALEVHPSIHLGGASTGFGFDFRGTYWLPSGRPRIGPEFLLGWAGFPVGKHDDAGVLRLMGGVRAAFDSGQVVPSLYGRFGFTSFHGPRWYGWWHRGPSLGHLAAEGGGALDFRVTDRVSLGGHAGLNLVTNGVAYLNLGAQMAVRF